MPNKKKHTNEKLGDYITKEQQELLSKALEVKEFFKLREREKELSWDLYDQFDLCICGVEMGERTTHTKQCIKYRKNLKIQRAIYHKTLKGKLQKAELNCLEQSLTVIIDMLCSIIGVKGLLGRSNLELLISGVEQLGIKCKDLTVRSLLPEDFGAINAK